MFEYEKSLEKLFLFEGFGKSSGEFAIRYYAKNLQPRGINANTIIPGVVNTEAWNGYVILSLLIFKWSIKNWFH